MENILFEQIGTSPFLSFTNEALTLYESETGFKSKLFLTSSVHFNEQHGCDTNFFLSAEHSLIFDFIDKTNCSHTERENFLFCLLALFRKFFFPNKNKKQSGGN
jgi:hypothetical protein